MTRKLPDLLDALCERPFADPDDGQAARWRILSAGLVQAADPAEAPSAPAVGPAAVEPTDIEPTPADVAALLSGRAGEAERLDFAMASLASRELRVDTESAAAFLTAMESEPLAAPADLVKAVCADVAPAIPAAAGRRGAGGFFARKWKVAAAMTVVMIAGGISWSRLSDPGSGSGENTRSAPNDNITARPPSPSPALAAPMAARAVATPPPAAALPTAADACDNPAAGQNAAGGGQAADGTAEARKRAEPAPALAAVGGIPGCLAGYARDVAGPPAGAPEPLATRDAEAALPASAVASDAAAAVAAGHVDGAAAAAEYGAAAAATLPPAAKPSFAPGNAAAARPPIRVPSGRAARARTPHQNRLETIR